MLITTYLFSLVRFILKYDISLVYEVYILNLQTCIPPFARRSMWNQTFETSPTETFFQLLGHDVYF